LKKGRDSDSFAVMYADVFISKAFWSHRRKYDAGTNTMPAWIGVVKKIASGKHNAKIAINIPFLQKSNHALL